MIKLAVFFLEIYGKYILSNDRPQMKINYFFDYLGGV
jgi:hypothetical protein